MSLQRSYWLHVPLTKQLKRDLVGHGEVTINNPDNPRIIVWTLKTRVFIGSFALVYFTL